MRSGDRERPARWPQDRHGQGLSVIAKKSKAQSGVAPGYLHGFTEEEQDRLYRQARFFEAPIFEHVDFSGRSRLLEVGSGVGAQTEILLRKFPQLTIQGVDASPSQVKRAEEFLAKAVAQGKARFTVGDALHLPSKDNTFDSAFVCWLLEHVQEPVGILREIRRALAAGGVVYCNEVLNATLYVHPYSPATLQYWFALNDHQWTLKGDPFIGAKLGNYLTAAGFQDVTTEIKTLHYDNRAPKKRADAFELFTSLLLSAAPGMIEAGKVTEKLTKDMTRELAELKNDPDAVFFFSWVQARAFAY